MRWSPPAHRGLDIIAPITIYRIIGRRPSGVYVDDRLQPTQDHAGGRPLWDHVFLKASAEPGDQLQDRPGGLLLVTKAGEAFPVQLTAPQPRCLDAAFTHADQVLAADRALAEQMLSDGRLAAGTIRRRTQAPERPSQTRFAADHPLVVDTPPIDPPPG